MKKETIIKESELKQIKSKVDEFLKFLDLIEEGKLNDYCENKIQIAYESVILFRNSLNSQLVNLD